MYALLPPPCVRTTLRRKRPLGLPSAFLPPGPVNLRIPASFLSRLPVLQSFECATGFDFLQDTPACGTGAASHVFDPDDTEPTR